MKIKTITVTGADESVKPQRMVELQKEFPKVEWGILLSQSSEGRPRFPKLEWMESLKGLGLNLSGHLCGRWVRDLIKGEATFWSERPSICSMFDRIQINFSPYIHNISHQAFIDALLSVSKKKPVQFIFQLKDINEIILNDALEAGVDAVSLFDTSGGLGRLPEEWPHTDRFSGFAGGLGPDNLTEQLDKINKSAEGQTIWIDAESRLRTDDNETFLMSKVSSFLEQGSHWVSDG